MADSTPIEWTDATWNPITGCTLVSEGCRHCYAARIAATRMKRHWSRKGLARLNAAGEAKFTGEVRFNAQWLDQPLAWKRSRQIFVCAHGDLFHESVPDDWIDQVFAVMALCPQHVFQVLTKRPERMRRYFSGIDNGDGIWLDGPELRSAIVEGTAQSMYASAHPSESDPSLWLAVHLPLPNVWLGTSIEDQPTADTRIPYLLATPAAVRWISAEPLLGPTEVLPYLFLYTRDDYAKLEDPNRPLDEPLPWRDPATTPAEEIVTPRLDWVVVGGESGPGARPMHPDWARSLRDQCAAADVPFFLKQWGAWLDADQIAARAMGDDAIAHILRDGKRWLPQLPLTFDDAAWLGRLIGREPVPQSDGRTLFAMTKDAAGRRLDGVEHDGMPPFPPAFVAPGAAAPSQRRA